MRTSPLFLLFWATLSWGLAPCLQAGTEVKAYLQSTKSVDYWLNVKASIQQGQMRLDWKGPWSKGSLFYDRDTSQVALADPLHRTVLLLPATDQTSLKLMLALSAGSLKERVNAAGPGARRTYGLAAQNARALFNGTPQLEKKGIPDGNFSCDEYVVYGPYGDKMREVWVTPSDGTPLAGEDYNTFRSLAHLAFDLSSSLAAQLGVDTSAFEQNFSGIDFPVREVVYAKGRPSLRFKVLGIQARDFDTATFQWPQDYKMMGLIDLLRQN